MDVAKLIVPAAAILVIAGGFFGVVAARVIWADEATHAAKLRDKYESIRRSYTEIYERDQQTMNALRETIDILKSGK